MATDPLAKDESAGEPPEAERDRESLCDECWAIKPGMAGRAHPQLFHLGYRYLSERGCEHYREDRYRCATCGTVWISLTDRWDTHLGFRLGP